jgi:hypothetical protein
MEPNVFPTTPLMRPDQLQRAREEIKGLEDKLRNPLIQDKGQVQKQLVNAKRLTEMQTPRPPEDSAEEGRMVNRSNELLGKILEGMPSQEEMRKAPPGAVDKHLRWERKNKTSILEWKNLQLRLRPGEGEAANLERHRPTTSSLNMDSAQIQGKQFYMPETTGPSVVFSEEQIAHLRRLSPALADQLSLMTNEQRSMVKDHISGIGLAEPSAASVAGKRGVEKREANKRQISEAQKAAMKAGREAAAQRKAKQEQT